MSKVYSSIVDMRRFFTMTFNMFRFKKVPENYSKGSKNPIVLIPGVGCRWGAMKGFADFLNSNGYPIYIAKDLGDNFYPIPKSSGIVRIAIEKNNLKNAVIVAHSKGGLIGKYLLIHDNSDKKVLGMVSMAAPFSGSTLANLLVIDKWKQFGTENPMILELQKDTQINKRIVSISPSYDTVIWNKNKSDLPQALENITSSANGHLNIIYDKNLRKLVLDSIEKFSALA